MAARRSSIRKPRVPPIAVAGAHERDGWKVALLMLGGERVMLSAEQARDLARDLVGVADVVEGVWQP